MRAALPLLSMGVISAAAAQGEPNGKPFAPEDAGIEVRRSGEPLLKPIAGGDHAVPIAGAPRTTLDDLSKWAGRKTGRSTKQDPERVGIPCQMEVGIADFYAAGRRPS